MSSDDQPAIGPGDPLLDEFANECEEHLSAARNGLLALESRLDKGGDRAVVDELFRNFHTIKGLAGMVGMREAELLAHQMESYLDAVRQSRVRLTSAAIDALAAGIGGLESIVTQRTGGAKSANLAELLARLATLGQPTGAASEPTTRDSSRGTGEVRAAVAAAVEAGRRVWSVKFVPSPTLSERGINVNTVRQRLLDAGEVIHAEPLVLTGGEIAFVFLLSSQAEPATFEPWLADGIAYAPYEAPAAGTAATALEAQPPEEEGGARVAAPVLAPSNAIRVDLAKLDDVMRMVSDLVITRAHFEDQLKRMAQLIPAQQARALEESNLAFERQIRDLREGVVRVRLVPVREIFARMQFVVRDLARECGKQVVLRLSGQDTEVDKLVVERMMDPLLHLVRNAISHGIEPAAERAKAGKHNPASIDLRASAAGETIIIEVEDNGRGIDVADVARRAQAAGAIAGEMAPDEAALLDTICLPHFSTRDEADRASGRGMGMAIVKTAVEQLGGSLTLQTQAGHGSRFRIQLPLTLAIADALVVRVGGQRFAVPQSAVREVIPLEAKNVTVLENNEVLSHRGRVVPIVRLSKLFRRAPEPNARPCALIVGEDAKAVGIVVDAVLGLHEVVVRPLTDPLVRVPGISGATELGDGQVVLILDAVASARFARAGAEYASTVAALRNSDFRQAISR